MPDIVQQYIQAQDNALDYADSLMEGLEQKALEDIDDLIVSDINRDEDLWREFGIDTESILMDFEEDDERGLDWIEGLAGVSAASKTQFFLDNSLETIVLPLAYLEQKLAGFTLTEAQLVQAGKRGFEVIGTAKYDKISQLVLNELSFLQDIDNVQLYNTLFDYGAIRPIEQAIGDASGYVARMTNYRPGSPQFKESVADLVSTNSKRGLKSANRQAVSQIHAYRESGGDTKVRMVWIVEGGKNTCEYCLDRRGQVRTYGEWLDAGMPGSDVCKGGYLCKCQLAAV